jgi:conjugal transfer pilus assembly protein TraF
LTAAEQMQMKRQEIEERLNQAILNPTEENVQAYMQIQQQWINQSAQFSHIWLKNLLTHPQLDSRLTAGPVTHYGE